MSVKGEPNEDIGWAIQKINAYQYRKTFGLSEEEFRNEPVDVYLTNLAIMQMINQEKERQVEKRNRK